MGTQSGSASALVI